MPCCAIITCKKKSQTSSMDRGGISFHRFPKESNLRERWIEVTGRENWISTKTSTICSNHFGEDDFIIKKSGHRYLKPNVIPSKEIVHIHSTQSDSCTTLIFEKPDIDPIKCERKETVNLQIECHQKLQNVIKYQDHIIKKQRLKIKRVQAQNQRLKLTIDKMQQALNYIQDNFCQ